MIKETKIQKRGKYKLRGMELRYGRPNILFRSTSEEYSENANKKIKKNVIKTP